MSTNQKKKNKNKKTKKKKHRKLHGVTKHKTYSKHQPSKLTSMEAVVQPRFFWRMSQNVPVWLTSGAFRRSMVSWLLPEQVHVPGLASASKFMVLHRQAAPDGTGLPQ